MYQCNPIRKYMIYYTFDKRKISNKTVAIFYNSAGMLEKTHTLFLKGHKFDMSLTQRCDSI